MSAIGNTHSENGTPEDVSNIAGLRPALMNCGPLGLGDLTEFKASLI